MYWFVLEFGLFKEGADYKFIGAAFTGSNKHIDDFKSIPKEIDGNRLKNFELNQHSLPYAEFKLTNVQPYYYIIESADDLKA